MGTVGKIFLTVAAIAASYYLPGIGQFIAGQLGTSLFVGTLIGAVVITAGLTLASSLLISRPRAPSIESGKVNVRLAEPPRWDCAGFAMQGGGALFGEFDGSGNFWYLIIHSDSILTDNVQYYLDGIPVTLDGSGNVTTNDFCLNDKKEPYNGSGTRVPYVQIWTTTYTEDDPTPGRIAALDGAFPSLWTADHRLVGTTFSVIKMKALKAEDRYKIYKWRGPFAIGEPSVAIVGQWSNMYDPRDPEQTLGDRSTYKPSRNSVVIWAWWRTHPYGRRKPESSINWDKVAEQADICDQTVTGIAGDHVRYECGTAIVNSKERFEAEQEIIMSCDGQLVFDDDGKSWVRVGYYYTPTVALSRNRDIIAMESVEAQNGESETQGVIVRYIEPSMDYTAQPSAPWYNPLYYRPGEANTFLTVDILTIQDHNQAMRIAKAIGERSQPLHKLAPTTGLRGLRARSERIINLNYDNTFAGDYEIATPIEIDESGMFCGSGIVPINENRWTLLPGEEKSKPGSYSTEGTVTVDAPTGVTVTFNNGRIEATFDAPDRDDVSVQFQYIKTVDIASEQWSDMVVSMDNLFAYSGVVSLDTEYTVRYRSVSSSGRVSDWVDTTTDIPLGMDEPVLLTVFLASEGPTTVVWRNPTSTSFNFCEVWRGTTNVFGAATKIESSVIGGLGQIQEIIDNVSLEDYYYYWIVAVASDGVTKTQTGPIGPLDTTPNGLTPPNDFTVWTPSNSGSGSSNPIVTSNDEVAPDGTTTADRIQFSRGASGFSMIYRIIATETGKSYKFGMWLKASSAGYSVAFGITGAYGPALSLTTDWQYYALDFTAGSTSVVCQLAIYNLITNSPTTTDVDAWGAQLVIDHET